MADYLNGLREKIAPATVNRYHAVLKSIFNRAIEWDEFSGPNPAARVRMMQVPGHRLRFLSKEEMHRLLEACHPRLYPVVVCALMTGMRKAEILGLDWENTDIEHDVIYVLKSKSGRPREVLIAPQLKEVLVSLRPRAKGPVFELPDIMLRRFFEKALKDSGIANFRFHDLRHTFASHYIMNTGDLPALQLALGHASFAMTQRYAHLSKSHLRRNLETFSKQMVTIWSQTGVLAPAGKVEKCL
ncbi:MAG: tyrosine-type recombinase/integrase [bacterium]